MTKKKSSKKFANLPSVFKIPLLISGALIVLCLISIFYFGLKLDIDFVGGSVLEIESDSEDLTKDSINNSVQDLLPENTIIKVFEGKKKANIEMTSISDAKHDEIIEKLKSDQTYVVENKKENGEKFVLEVGINGDRTFTKDNIQSSLRDVSLFGYDVSLSEDSKTATITGDPIAEEEKIGGLVDEIRIDNSAITELSFRNVGSIIGKETKQKAILSISLALVGIILYLAWSFQKVSKAKIGFKSWHYGLAAIITLVHDLVLVLGIFAVLGYFMDITVGTYYLISLLTILGYSVNDTIVIFDRLRDNLLHGENDNLGLAMIKSIKQSAKRSLYTSFTTLIVLGFLYFLGGEDSEVIKYFSLALFIGILVGTYSSIFIANSLLFFLHKER